MHHIKLHLFVRDKCFKVHYSNSKHAATESMKYRSFKEIPGPKVLPVIGTLYKYLPFIGDYSTETLDKNAWFNWRQYGPIVKEELFNGVGLLNLFYPEDMEEVLRQEDKYPHRHSHIALHHYKMSKPGVYSSGGLLATNSPEWWRLRSTFQKDLTGPQSVTPFVKRTDDITQSFIMWLQDTDIAEREDFLYYLNRLFLEVIGVVAFDEHFNSFSSQEQGAKSRATKVIDAAFKSNCGIHKLDTGFMWQIFKTPLYRKLARAQGYLETVSQEILMKRLKFYKTPNTNEQKCLLDKFLTQPNINIKDITGMMVDILMAGIDTTSFSTCFLLYHIATNPCAQQKLFEEALTLLPHKDSAITPEVLSRANYTRCCVKESLRLNPVAIGFSRTPQKDIVLRDYIIPKGTVIVFQNMVASRLERNVKNPLKFFPERWMRETDTKEEIHPFTSLPFGFGRRSCIARRLAEQNMCIVLMRMIRNYTLKWNGNNLGIVTHLINKPDKPAHFKFEKRFV